MATKAKTRTRSVTVIHEDEKCIRREVRVTGVPQGVRKKEVESLVNRIVCGIPFPSKMFYGDLV